MGDGEEQAGQPGGRALLLTGRPGVGKTTVLREAADRLRGLRIAGFYTEEVRDERGRRAGFRAVGFSGDARPIAHVDFAGPRVSRYGVDVEAIDELSVAQLALREEVDVYLVDEIGKMECLSGRFVEAVRRLLDSERPLVATVGGRGGGFIREAKERLDTEVWEVTRENRDDLPHRVVEWLEGRRGGGTPR